MSKEANYQYENIVRAITTETWLCEERKMEQITQFLEIKAAGGEVTEAEVQEQMVARSDTPEMFLNSDGERIDVDGIRYIPLMGVMAPRMNLIMRFSGGTSTLKTTKAIEAAAKDEGVKTVLLHVDSPGGVASMVPELATAIRKLRKDKRVIAIGEGMIASGALWAATAASKVFATESTKVGSQGAYQVFLSEHKRNEEDGRQFVFIRAGEFKALGNRYEPVTAKAKRHVQQEVDELNQRFIEAMAKNRGVSEDHVRDEFGAGRTFFADEAVSRKLIDGVATFDTVLDRERKRNSTATTVSLGAGFVMKVTPKVKAALFANDCIESIDASDEVCVAYLRGFAKSTGQKLEDADEGTLIAAINKPEAAEPDSPEAKPDAKDDNSTTGIDAKGDEYETSVVDPERYVTRDQVSAERRARIAEIRLAANELNVSSDVLAEALASDDDIETIRERFTKAASETDTSVAIFSGSAAADKVAQAVSGWVLGQVEIEGVQIDLSSEERNYSRSMHDMSFLEVAREVNRVNGIQRQQTKEMDARMFLRSGLRGAGKDHMRVLHANDHQMVSEASYNRSGDHPDVLSNLMGRMMDIGYDQAEHTYPVFTKKVPDVPDRRPKTFFEHAIFHELDARGEDEKHKQLKFDNQMKAMIQVAKYGNKVGLTEEMIIDDDLSVFDAQLTSLQEAAVNTVDNSCRTLFVSNPNMLEDGLPMFSEARGNYIPAGQGSRPNASSAARHRTMHRMIKGYGSDRVMNKPPTESLHPAEHEEAVRQAFLFNAADPKVAQTDGNVNTIRGTIKPHMDAMLDGYQNGKDEWYTFVPKYKPLIISFLRGKGGPRGFRTTWQDPDTGTRYVAIDLWAGYAALNWRGTVKNAGK